MKIKKKILKNIFIQNILGLIMAIYIFIVRITSSIHIENKSIPDTFWKQNKPFILAFWHSQLMMISFCWKSNKKINILASAHSDGRFGSIVGKYYKLQNIPTSSSSLSRTHVHTSIQIILPPKSQYVFVCEIVCTVK